MLEIGILIFPDVEELDFVGPFETLAYINKFKQNSVSVEIIAKHNDVIKAFNGLRVVPDNTISSPKQYDILIVPGGQGRKKAMFDKEILDYVKHQAKTASFICSVCTGAFILAEANLLEGLNATTHYTSLNEMKERYPSTTVLKERVVKNETIWLAAGISSGIDLALELIKILFGKEYKEQIAQRLEYTPQY